MSYCINPICHQPNDLANANNRVCRHCGSDLLIQNRYQVMRLLSDKSGFGKIYEAYEGAVPKILKVLKEEHNNNLRAVELFQQEAIVLSHLNHPGIPKVNADGYFQFFPRNRSEPVHCIVMEKVEGSNLKQWMSQHQNHPIGEKQALNWLVQLAEILHLVHQQNYFHRDIKPENIMMRSTGQLVLIDFGTAREMTYTYLAEVSGAGITKISSPGYTPPEQENGHAVPQSDFYALGRTFVFLLTGKQLTDQDIYNPLTDEFLWRNYAPDLADLLADFIDKLMAHRASARHRNTQAILDNLAEIFGKSSQFSPRLNLSNAPTAITSPMTITSIPTQLEKPIKKWLMGGAIALTISLGGYAGWRVYNYYISQSIAIEKIFTDKILAGHSSSVNHVVVSADGQTLVSASADKTIKIWNIATGQEIRTLRGHSSFVNYVAISPDGQTLISGSADNTIKIWNLSTGQQIRTLVGHSSSVNDLVISHDGQTLISGGADNTIKIWNLSNGKEIRTLRGHSSFINDLAISPDGQIGISGSADKTIKTWNLATGQEILTLTGHSSSVNSVAITPDGQTLVSASADKTIKIWDLATGREIRTLTGHSSYVNYVVISRDGEKLFSASADKTVKIWNLSTGQEIRTFTGYPNPINYLAISPDERTVATGSGDRIIKIWHIVK
jgi:serine/threonine protein kinase